MINFRVNVWSKNMLSVTSSKKCCLIEVIFSIIETFTLDHPMKELCLSFTLVQSKLQLGYE